MQNHKFRNCLQMLFISLVAAFVVTSCTKEDLSQCNSSYNLAVRAFNAEQEELSSEAVGDVALYVFDHDKRFLGIHTDAQIGKSVLLSYPNHDSLTVVAWGNATQGHQTLPTLTVGDKMEAAQVLLIKAKSPMATIQSPDDLFYGAVMLTRKSQEVVIPLPMTRKTSAVTITARQLKQYANAADDNFAYVLRQTRDKINFEGKEMGEYSHYRPEASFDNKQEFVTPIFNILTTTSDIEVDIFHDDKFVATITKDSSGKLLQVEAGKTLNILVDFRGDIFVSVAVTPWGVQQIWKEFN